MNTRQQLLARLDAIAQALKQTEQGLALLGLGSAGLELQRLDNYSDLDFFVIAKPGGKRYFLDSLAWLEMIQPIPFSFRNTVDGHKFLLSDGIFCETAVFEPAELQNIPYAGARVVWQDENSAHSFPPYNNLPETPAKPASVEWLVGEILSNLFVGLGRFRRGEKLTAARFIQGYAVDHILELAPFVEDPQPGIADPFDKDRRFKQRYPKTAAHLPAFKPGYSRTPQAARNILQFVKLHFAFNSYIENAILSLSHEGVSR